MRMTLPDKDGERGLLCMINMKSHNADGKYYIPLCFTRASEIIRNASDQVKEILSPYGIVQSSGVLDKHAMELAKSVSDSRWRYKVYDRAHFDFFMTLFWLYRTGMC